MALVDDFAITALIALANNPSEIIRSGFKEDLLPSENYFIADGTYAEKQQVKKRRKMYREVYQTITDYVSRHGNGPPWAHIQQEYESFRLPAEKATSFSAEEIVEQLHNHKRAEHAMVGLQQMEGILEERDILSSNKDVLRIAEIMRDCVTEITALSADDVDRVEEFQTDDLLANYRDLRDGKLSGIPLPFFELSEPFNHLQKGYAYGMIGSPGVKKTFVLAYCAAHMAANANVPTFLYSSEMDSLDLRRRIAAMLAGVSYDGVIKGKLENEQFKKYKRWMKGEAAENLRKNLFVGGPTSCTSLIDLDRVLAEHSIEVACVDTIVNLAMPSKETGDIAAPQVDNLMRNLRPVLFRRGCACLYTSHFNRYGGQRRSGIAHGDAFFKWSAFMWAMRQEGKEHKEGIVFTGFKARDASNSKEGLVYNFDVVNADFKYIGVQSKEDKSDEERKQTPLSPNAKKLAKDLA